MLWIPIENRGVSDNFRAADRLPDGAFTVDEWIAAIGNKFELNKYGWLGWYPTRTLQGWEKARAQWEPCVMRGPKEKMPSPSMGHSKKKADKRAP